VDAAGKSLLVGDSLQKGGELLLFVVAEGGEEGLLVFAGDAADGLERGASLGCEMEEIAAAIIGIIAALDQGARFEIVEQGDQLAGKHAQDAGQGALGEGDPASAMAAVANARGKG